jgi:aquaporin Z
MLCRMPARWPEGPTRRPLCESVCADIDRRGRAAVREAASARRPPPETACLAVRCDGGRLVRHGAPRNARSGSRVAALAAAFPGVGIGLLGVSLAFGLTALPMAYAVGAISGGHFNPAVTIGLVSAGRFKPGFDPAASGYASNGYAEHSPGGYSLGAALLSEFVMTFFFLMIILGATGPRAPAGSAPIAIGLALTIIHLISIPVTNTSVNPARSTGPALVLGGWALSQLWLFWVAPIGGAIVAGLVQRRLFDRPTNG